MDKDSVIYIAGHTGFIGAAILKKLKGYGYENLVCRTRDELDLTDQARTERFFEETKPEYVFLFAARVGGIYANSTYPADFIYQNLAIQTNVIHAAYKYGVKKLLFPGSACMYPKFCPQPMVEEYLLTGAIEPTNEPFAVAKVAGIKMCQSYNRQHKTNFICVVPATVYGKNDHFGVNGHVVSGLIEKFYNAVSGRTKKEVAMWGTGKPKREFIYIDDIADACVFLMKNYSGNEMINIGSGEEVSIMQLAQKLKEISRYEGNLSHEIDKPDGIPRRMLNSDKIRDLGWIPKVSLDVGLRKTYAWYANVREGDTKNH